MHVGSVTDPGGWQDAFGIAPDGLALWERLADDTDGVAALSQQIAGEINDGTIKTPAAFGLSQPFDGVPSVRLDKQLVERREPLDACAIGEVEAITELDSRLDDGGRLSLVNLFRPGRGSRWRPFEEIDTVPEPVGVIAAVAEALYKDLLCSLCVRSVVAGDGVDSWRSPPSMNSTPRVGGRK